MAAKTASFLANGQDKIMATLDGVTARFPLSVFCGAIRTMACKFEIQQTSQDMIQKQRIVHILKKVCYNQHPYTTNMLLACDPNDLLWMYTSAHVLRKKNRTTLKRKILGLLRRYHNAPSLQNICMKIPFNHYNRASLRTHMNHLIRQTILPPWMKSFIRRKTRIVFTKRPSIGDMMCNLIQSTKDFTTEPPACTCTQLGSFLGIPTDQLKCLPAPLDGHVSIRARDLPSHLHMLKQSIKNVPIPSHIDAQREVSDGFHAFYRRICKFNIPQRGQRPRAGISTPYASRVEFSLHTNEVSLMYFEKEIMRISLSRYLTLKRMYFHTKHNHHAIHGEHAGRSLHESLVNLAKRYKKVVTRPFDHVLTPLANLMEATCNLFGDPLNTPDDLHYFSRYPEDQLFGAAHDAFQHQWRGSAVGYPRGGLAEQALAHAMEAVLCNPTPTAIALIVPNRRNLTMANVLGTPNAHTIATIHTTHHWRTRIIQISNSAFLLAHQPRSDLCHALKRTIMSLPGSTRYFGLQPHMTLTPIPFPMRIWHLQKRTPAPWHRRRPTNGCQPSHSTTISLSNVLNRCFARPCDATIECEFSQIKTAAPTPPCDTPASRYAELRAQLGNSIFFFQDKNQGACTIECPRLHWAREKRMY